MSAGSSRALTWSSKPCQKLKQQPSLNSNLTDGGIACRVRQRKRPAARVENERDSLRGQLRGETATRFQAQEVAIDNAIAQAETEATTLEGQWSSLQAEGKFDEAGKVTRRMAEVAARLDRYRGQKELVGHERQRSANTPQQTDPLSGYSPAARAWIEKIRGFEDQAFRLLSPHNARSAKAWWI
jgi:hypothetical protein